MDSIKNLDVIADPTAVVGFTTHIEDGDYVATSDIDLSSFLWSKGIQPSGIKVRTFRSKTKTKNKIFLVFDNNEALQNAYKEWMGDEGSLIRKFKSSYKHLMIGINDLKHGA